MGAKSFADKLIRDQKEPMTPEEAAVRYVSDTWTTVQDGIPEYARLCFLAGARFERERILGMLRGEDATEVDYFHKPVGLSSIEWADWLEAKLKEKK